MIKIDFSQLGGYRLKQATFDKLQLAHFEILKALTTVLQLEDVGNYIISGCTVVGANITPGLMYIDGELCPFAGAPGTLASKIKKNVLNEALAFKNGSNPNVFRTTTAVIDAAGVLLSDFVRASPVLDPDYVHTDENFTAADALKLFGIEAGAQVNVTDDWLATLGTPGYIANKPTGLLQYLWNGEIHGIPDFDTRYKITASFPDVGTSNYLVVGSFISETGSDWQGDCNVSWTVKDQANSSFDLCMQESSGTSQNIFFKYMLIKLP